MTNEHGLQPADNDTYRALADKLRSDTTDVSAVQDFISTPALRPVDGQQGQQGLLHGGDAEGAGRLARIFAGLPTDHPDRQAIHRRLGAHSARDRERRPSIGDLSIVSARDMHVIEIATALLVLIILLVIYRRPVTVLLPLITIGVSVASAQGLVSALTQIGLSVSAITIVLMTAMIVGAGTDYAVFLISRYHEYIRSGMDSDVAVQKRSAPSAR